MQRNLAEHFFIAEESHDGDLAKAQPSHSLSAIGLSDDQEVFAATSDHLRFQNLTEVVRKILVANGFVDNFENIISCLGDLSQIAVCLGRSGITHVKKYKDGLKFRLPSKGHTSDLLKMFYKEIEAYESAMSKIASMEKGKNLKDDAVKNLETENKRIESENNSLQQKLRSMSEKVDQLTSLRFNQAVEKDQLDEVLPDDLKLGHVKNLNFRDREIQIKVGRKIVQVPMVCLHRVPEMNEVCIVNIESGLVRGAMVMENHNENSTSRLAEVLRVKGAACKVRDALRNSFVIEARNDFEKKIIADLVRGQEVLLSFEGEHLFRFERLVGHQSSSLSSFANENECLFQLHSVLQGQNKKGSRKSG